MNQQITINSDADHATLTVDQTPAANVVLTIEGDQQYATMYLGPAALVQLLTALTKLTDQLPSEEMPMLWAVDTKGQHNHAE